MITLNSKYAIDSDASQWMLCKHHRASEKSDARWVAFKYYGSLSACMEGAQGYLLRISDYECYADLTKNLAEINKMMDKAVKVNI